MLRACLFDVVLIFTNINPSSFVVFFIHFHFPFLPGLETFLVEIFLVDALFRDGRVAGRFHYFSFRSNFPSANHHLLENWQWIFACSETCSEISFRSLPPFAIFSLQIHHLLRCFAPHLLVQKLSPHPTTHALKQLPQHKTPTTVKQTLKPFSPNYSFIFKKWNHLERTSTVFIICHWIENIRPVRSHPKS